MGGGAPSFFFFSSRRRHTRFKCDWSSDVCSSDPLYEPVGHIRPSPQKLDPRSRESDQRVSEIDRGMSEIGRESWRKRGWISGGARYLKKKMPELSCDKLLPLRQRVMLKGLYSKLHL